MSNAKIGRPTKERMALIKGLATDLLWYGKIETTLARAKEVRPYVEKILTLAINSYKDTVSTEVKRPDQLNAHEIKDGSTKLAARREIMRRVYDVKEQKKAGEKPETFSERAVANHPLIEKIFDQYAPFYDKRAEATGSKGGYTRIIKIGKRQGDNAELAIIEMV